MYVLNVTLITHPAHNRLPAPTRYAAPPSLSSWRRAAARWAGGYYIPRALTVKETIVRKRASNYIICSRSFSAYSSPLRDAGLFQITPLDPIYSFPHPTITSHLLQVIMPPFRQGVIQFIWSHDLLNEYKCTEKSACESHLTTDCTRLPNVCFENSPCLELSHYSLCNTINSPST
jgi:hypothetical protein